MGGNFAVKRRRLALMGGPILVWGWMALGATLAAEGFWTTGRGYADWHWLDPSDHARWEFFTLPAGGNPHVAVEAFLCLAVPNGDVPSEIEVRFQIGTGTARSRLWVTRMQRIQANDGHAMYFGQLFLSRREIGLGSRLTVRLDGVQSRFALGVHRHSVRVRTPEGWDNAAGPEIAAGAVAGRGGGLDEVRGLVPSTQTAMARGVPTVRSLPDSTSVDDAPFLTPGVYRGELGWPGPYHAPDGQDVYRVHLRVGQIVTVRIEATSECVLVLLDPTGQKVAEIAGAWAGLEHRAHVAGAWQILVICRAGGPRFPYTLTLGIR